MNLFLKASLRLFLLHMPLAAQASGLDLNIGNETVALSLIGPINSSDLNVSISGMHHQNDRDVLTTGLSVIEQTDVESHIGIGANIYAFDAPEIDGVGLALGGFFRQALPQVPHLGLGGQVFYGPSIVSMDSADDFLDATLRLEYQVIHQANIYLGYRKIKVFVDDEIEDEGEIDSSWVAGMRLTF